MKDFKVAPVASEEDEELFGAPPENETSLARWVNFVKSMDFKYSFIDVV